MHKITEPMDVKRGLFICQQGMNLNYNQILHYQNRFWLWRPYRVRLLLICFAKPRSGWIPSERVNGQLDDKGLSEPESLQSRFEGYLLFLIRNIKLLISRNSLSGYLFGEIKSSSSANDLVMATSTPLPRVTIQFCTQCKWYSSYLPMRISLGVTEWVIY